MTSTKTQKPRKFFSEIFKSEFSILAVGQNQQLENKKTGNNISKISEISEVPKFFICHFFVFFISLFFLFFYKCFFSIFILHL